MADNYTPPANHARPSTRGPWIVFSIIFLGALWMVSHAWNASILDRYEFRQVQTALSAFWVIQDGFRLDYLTPIFGPPWSIPMEFPIYQWSIAALVGLTQMPLEQAGRLLSVLFFVATLPAVYDLLALAGLSASRRLLALALILSAPVYLFYTRTVMIETTALCFSLWFLCCLRRGLESLRISTLFFTCLFALLAALTKITTFAVYGIPAAVLTLAALRRANQGSGPTRWVGLRRCALFAFLPAALSLGAATWWIAHGDGLKHSNPYAGFLASTELRHWNYGTLALRLEPSYWQRIWETITQNVLSEGAMAAALVCGTLATARARRVALVCWLGFLSGPLVFANLYHVHDYYYTANALLLTGAAGLLLASAWDNPRVNRGTRWVALAVMLILQYHAFDRSYHYYYWKEAPPPPDLAKIMRETIPVDGVVLISGANWDPVLTYYSQRRSLMIPGDRDDETKVLDDVLAKLPPRRIAAMVVVGKRLRQAEDFISARAARFGFSPRPFASSDDADLYLTSDIIIAAAQKLQGQHFKHARVLMTSAADTTIPDALEQNLTGLAFPMCTPAPQRARSQFGVSLEVIANQPRINAHAPSEIIFLPPVGAHKITATVGLAPSAYAKPLPEASDGVDIEILTEQPNGLRYSLYRRRLAPATNPADRGAQEITYQQANPLIHPIIFLITPGPAGNQAYDQAYWSQITIR